MCRRLLQNQFVTVEVRHWNVDALDPSAELIVAKLEAVAMQTPFYFRYDHASIALAANSLFC